MIQVKSQIIAVFEKFDKVYRAGSLANARWGGQVEFDMVSKGWYISLDGAGIAISVGPQPPDLTTGEIVIVTIEREH